MSEQKRLFDVTGMTALLPVLGSIGVASAGAIASIDRMSPIYTSTRYGLGSKPFDCHKLRTMPPSTIETPSIGSHSDPRATKLGSILRKAHFDEIPQAINIYRGEMSLVGIRPLIKEDILNTRDVLDSDERKDFDHAMATVKPAPFGLYQLQAHMNDYDSSYEQTLRERALANIEYSKTATMRGDIDLIMKSITQGVGSIVFKDSAKELARGERTAALFGDVAQSAGVQLDADELAYWRSFLVVARTIDDAIDSEDDTDVDGMLFELLSGRPIGGMTADESTLFADIYRRKDPATRQRLLTAFMALPSFQARKRAAANIRDLTNVVHQESILFASILHLDTGDRSDSNARSSFNEWLDKFSFVGYMADSALDMRKDYNDGNISVEPSLSGRAVFLGNGAVEGFSALRSVPNRSLRRLAGSAFHALGTGK